jgi:hypothetical protein
MSSIDDQLTILYVLVDDFCRARPALAAGRHSPHQRPLFSDAAVLTIALLQGCLGVASWKQTYRLVAANWRAAFPYLCSYSQWMARLQVLTAQIRALLVATCKFRPRVPLFIWLMPSLCPFAIGSVMVGSRLGLWNTVQLKVIHYSLRHAGILSN